MEAVSWRGGGGVEGAEGPLGRMGTWRGVGQGRKIYVRHSTTILYRQNLSIENCCVGVICAVISIGIFEPLSSRELEHQLCLGRGQQGRRIKVLLYDFSAIRNLMINSGLSSQKCLCHVVLLPIECHFRRMAR